MVISNRATARKRIPKPEIAFQRDGIGGVGKCRRALVSCNNEIGIVTIADDHIVRMHDPVIDDVIGDRQQRPDKDFIGLGAFGKPGISVNPHVG